ncbi:MBL fold metallo-hydrolase [Dokdonella sp.]|uniref:MBL fold metallo-hydrolase n=1 Tax=Dokdonella sp. TaxID=2291710 RepID=UPI002F408F82
MSSPPVVHSVHHPTSGTWTHVVADPASGRAAVVDPVLDFDVASGRIDPGPARALLARIGQLGLEIAVILETHAHADHLSAGGWLRDRLGVPLAIGAGIIEVQRTFKRLLALGDDFPAEGREFDRLLRDGERVDVGTLAVRVIATPGHTSDSLAYLAGDALLVGDTMFAPAAGTARCDFPGGSAATLYRSIRRLYELPDATRVFLCHDYPAAGAVAIAQAFMRDEKDSNVHLRHDTNEDDYVAVREQRDATLAVPTLLWPAIQFNIRGGRLPPADALGRRYLKLPAYFDAD